MIINDHPRDQKINTAFALLVTSDTRDKITDKTGKTAIELIEKEGNIVKLYDIVPNELHSINTWLNKFLISDAMVAITSGGTGLGYRDKTVEAAYEIFEKEIPGFGEHLRRLSFEEIGIPGLWSRSTAGIAQGKIIFCLPGSTSAMEIALNEIILPGIGHMIWELERKRV
jgi:molybdenum cofactor biosynthesis protein B